MKKEYNAPIIEYLAFSAREAFTVDENELIPTDSMPWNDGDLGWT